MSFPPPTILPVRHHGPGSARAVRTALAELAPDIVLIEGPPDADGVVALAGRSEMVPPVALLVYRPDQPRRCAYFPFAVFSPEWQALQYANNQDIPARFCDLPQRCQLVDTDADSNVQEALAAAAASAQEPLQALAQAAGFSDHERWWNQLIEQRRDSSDVFAAVMTLMDTLRRDVDPELRAFSEREAQREAYMRRTIRAALEAGYRRIAVVCGAWHAPALRAPADPAADAALLADLPAVDVEATWVPWTYGRLAQASGYGAGIRAPGWYQHLWDAGLAGHDATTIGIDWLSAAARCLREAGHDAAPSQVIDGLRLAEALAALRGTPLPGLREFDDALASLLGEEPLEQVRRRLIVGEQMGRVPPDVPGVPLARDVAYWQEVLDLPPLPDAEELVLDLRGERDLSRSRLLHRLRLLDVGWGMPLQTVAEHGTYGEAWTLAWRPEFAALLVDAARWGNTVADAATARAIAGLEEIEELPAVTRLLDQVILADLAAVVEPLLARLADVAAVKRDVLHMMEALAPLARMLRYGSMRRLDPALIRRVIDGLVQRICVGLPAAARGLNDEAAQELVEQIGRLNALLRTLRDPAWLVRWHGALRSLLDLPDAAPRLDGYLCRLLFHDRVLASEEMDLRLRRAVSGIAGASPYPPLPAAAWLAGFLQGGALVLLHDDALWEVVDRWVAELSEEQFLAVAPLLRRTFSAYSEAERRRLGERVRRPGPAPLGPPQDPSRALPLLATIGRLLGVEEGEP